MMIYVVTYDISSDDRRAEVFDLLKSWGTHMQYSVFWCRLSAVQLVRLRAELHMKVDHEEDQVLFLCLGGADGTAQGAVSWVGKPFEPPDHKAFVV